MNIAFPPPWVALIALGAALASHAQTSSAPSNSQAPSRAQPAAQASAPADLSYRSAFESYQPFSDQKLGSWRDANDEVGRIGGWREYAKEAQGGASSAQGGQSGATAAPAPRPQTPAQPGHQKH